MKRILTPLIILFAVIVTLKAQDPLYDEIADKITFVVAQDGSGDYSTVMGAINATPNSTTERSVIYIKNGVYNEDRMNISSRKWLTLVGQNVDSTLLTFNATHGRTGFGSASLKASAKNLTMLNLTIENSYGVGNQAEALATSADAQQFAHCRLVGFQDTYYSGTSTRNYFKDCLFIGAVDYIFGNATVIFDDCQIHNLRDNSWITAASTSKNNRFGYVFRDCWVTGKYGVKDVFFGRPWKDYPKVLFMNCYLSDCISPLGWDNTWYDPNNIENVQFLEYKNYGPGSDISQRVSYSNQLSDEEANAYVMDTIFDHIITPAFRTAWNPTLEDDTFYMAVKKHVIPFLHEDVTKAILSGLKVNGEDIPGFDPNVEEVDITLPSGTTTWPMLEAIPESPEMKTNIMYPAKIPGTAVVVVSSKYDASHKEYKVNVKHDQQIDFEIVPETAVLLLSQNIVDCVTATADQLQENGATIYPNPSSGVFLLKVSNYASNDPVSVHIYNVMGQKVYAQTYMAAEIKVENRIDLSDFPSGQYLVKFYSNQKDYSTKIMLK